MNQAVEMKTYVYYFYTVLAQSKNHLKTKSN